MLLIFGVSCLAASGDLQKRAAIAAVGAQIESAMTPALIARTPALASSVATLIRESSAVRRVVVHDADGLLLARAGRLDRFELAYGAFGRAGASALYALGTAHGVVSIRGADGRVLGTVDFDIAPAAVAVAGDRAVMRLRIIGLLLLLSAASFLIAGIWLMRRRRRAPDWRRRADPGNDAGALPRPADAADRFESMFRERAGGLMDTLEYGIVSADRDGRVRYLNATAERLTGWPLAAARGRMAYSVVHLVDAQGEPMQTVLEAVLRKSGDAPIQRGWLRARDGVRRPVELQACPVRDAEHAIDGVAMLCRDISHHTIETDRLRREARLSQAIVDHLDEGVLVTDASGLVRFANARATRMFDYTRDELQGFTLAKLMPVPFLNTPGVRLTDYLAGADNAALPKIVGWRRDATTFPVELWVQPLQLEQSSGFVVIVRDISERLRGENLASRLGRLLDAAAEEVYIFDAQSLALLDVNRGARRNLGYRDEALMRMSPLDISEELDEAAFRGYLQQLRDGALERIVYRCRHRRRDGSSYPVEVRLTFSGDEQPPVYMAIAADISERLESEARLEQLAHYDALTGLPNRVMLRERLQQALTAQRRSDRLLGVFFLDLDRFKQINDAHGHDVGDLVLEATAERLRSTIRESDTVARLSGDEFVIVAPGLRSADDAAQLAQKLVDRFAQPLPIPGHHIVSPLSIGVTLYPLDDSGADDLLRHADMAMYDAKQAGGRGCFRLFTAEIDADRRRRLDLEREIHAALALNQFRLLLTPVLDGRDAAVVAVCVSRYWQHPRFGRIEEDELLRAGARAGLVGDLELWQITHAFEHDLDARRRGVPALPFIIPVSGWQLRTADFAGHVGELLRRYAMPGDRLILAVDPDGLSAAAPLLPATRGLLASGVRLALRDFRLPLPDDGGLPLQLLLAPALDDRTQMDAVVAAARARGLPLIAIRATPDTAAEWVCAGCALLGGGPVPTMEAGEAIEWLVGRHARPL